MFVRNLMMRGAAICYSPDEPAAAPASDAPLAAPGSTEPAPAGDTLLGGGDAPAGDAPAGDAPAGDDKPAEGDAPAETDEQKAERLANETPEEKATREAAELEAAGAPEEYADFTAPDGMTLDPDMTGKLKAIAKELNLPQARAQALMDLGVEHAQKIAEAQTQVLQNARVEWKDATKADPEIGGAKLTENVASAKKALDTYGSPALKELMEASGLGNHPEFIRLLAKVGKTITEDTVVRGDQTPGTKASGTLSYPSMSGKSN